MFTPAVLTLKGIASRISPIFIEWYLNLHYEKLDYSNIADMMIMLDILIDYNKTTVCESVHNCKIDKTMKVKLLEHIETHADRIGDIMSANLSFEEGRHLQTNPKKETSEESKQENHENKADQ